MACKLANNVKTTLAAQLLTAGTSITVPSGVGAKFADCSSPDYAYATISDDTDSVQEVVKVTARSGDTLTVARAQDGTSATDWAAGSRFERRANKLALTEATIGTIPGKQTIWVPAVAMIPRISNGPAPGAIETATNKIQIKTLDFDAASVEYAQFSVRMPKSWDEGTVTAEFVWSHPATATNFVVRWELRGVALSDGDNIEAAMGTAQMVEDTGGNTSYLYKSAETPAITIGGTPAENDLVVFEAYRNASHANDTLAVDARLHGVTIFYTVNGVNDA